MKQSYSTNEQKPLKSESYHYCIYGLVAVPSETQIGVYRQNLAGQNLTGS